MEPRVPIAPGQVGELSVIGTKDTAGQVKRHGCRWSGSHVCGRPARIMFDATDPADLDVRIIPPFDFDAAAAASKSGSAGHCTSGTSC